MKVSVFSATAALAALAAPAAADVMRGSVQEAGPAAERELKKDGSMDDGQHMSKSGKADLSFSLSMPSKSGKGSKADLSYSISMPSKSAKSEPIEVVESEMADGASKSSKALSYSISMPTKSAKAEPIEGSKSSKALSYSISMPTKSSKSSEFPDYCFDSFCYVDPTACDTGAEESGYFPALSYSYATCSADPEGPGEDGCACIDSSVILAAEIEAGNLESCDFNGEPGAITVSEGICLPLTYGSGECALHSLDEVFCGGGPKSAKAFKTSSKGSKADLSFSLSMPSKSAKSEPMEVVESEMADGASKSSKALSYSISMPTKSAKAEPIEGSKSSKALSYSISMPTKSSKSEGLEVVESELGAEVVESEMSDGASKSSKALSYSISMPSKSAKAEPIEGSKSSKALSYSISMPTKSSKSEGLEVVESELVADVVVSEMMDGASKSSKALSYSISMPSKSGKGSKADLSFSLSMPSKSGKSTES